MKQTILILLTFFSAAAMAERSEEEITLFDACKAYHNYMASRGGCSDLQEKMANNFDVPADDYRARCGDAFAFKKQAEDKAADYKKITGKLVDVSKCPIESQ